MLVDWLIFALSLCAVATFTCCCGGGTTTCSHCDSPPSDTMQVVLSGISNDDCTDCATLDGAYELSRIADSFGCQWQYIFSGADCGASQLRVVLSDFAPAGTVEVQLEFLYGGFNHYITWNDVITSAGLPWTVDCEFSSLSLPFVNVTGPGAHPCGGSGSTATVTSI